MTPATVPEDALVTYGLLREVASPVIAITGQASTDQYADASVTAAKGAIGAWHRCTASGTNTITLTPTTGTVAALADGMVVAFAPAATNTGAVTLQFNSGATTAKDLTTFGAALQAGDLKGSSYVEARYNATADDWELMTPARTYVPGYAADSSMTANTLTAAPAVSWTSYEAGRSIEVKVANTNTGAVTLAVSGLSAKDCRKNGTTALGAGDLVAGQVYRFTYDGTYFQLLTPPFTANLARVRDTSRGLVIAKTGDALVDVDAEEVMLATAGGVPLLVQSVNLTLDIGSGNALLGRENGASEGANSWYYIWLLSNGSTTSAVLGTSRTAPNLGAAAYSGYTYYGLVGAIYNNNSSHLSHVMHKQGDVWRLRSVGVALSTSTGVKETLNNPFSATPNRHAGTVRCTSTDAEYATGDEVDTLFLVPTGGGDLAVGMVAGSSTLSTIQFTANLSILQKTALSSIGITEANWTVYMTAEWWGV